MENYTIKSLNEHFDEYKYFVIDEKVYYIYEDFFDSLEDKTIFLLKSPEEDKNLTKIQEALEFFIKNGIERKDQLVSLGGGATSDFCGFLASIILRGVDWVAIPTTVLGIVDASVGGKTGVNLNIGKNLAGSFHKPHKTFLSTDFLKTLPESERTSGYCEVLKYAFLNRDIYEFIQSDFDEFNLFKKCIDYKMSVVEEDFKEGNIRKILNLGHTIGHAIEKTCDITHGEAILIGLEIKTKIFCPKLLSDLDNIKKQLNIEVIWPKEIDKNEFENYLKNDKKRSNSMLEYIEPIEIGKIEINKISFDDFLNLLYKKENYGSLFS